MALKPTTSDETEMDETEGDDGAPGINLSKVCFIVVKARAFDVKDEALEMDYGSNASDDAFYEVLETHRDDQTYQELTAAIDDLNEDEQCRLVALAWIGRGTYDASEWDEALEAAVDGHNERTAVYLTSLPLLADYLEEGLSAFGLSCIDVESEHL